MMAYTRIAVVLLSVVFVVCTLALPADAARWREEGKTAKEILEKPTQWFNEVYARTFAPSSSEHTKGFRSSSSPPEPTSARTGDEDDNTLSVSDVDGDDDHEEPARHPDVEDWHDHFPSISYDHDTTYRFHYLSHVETSSTSFMQQREKDGTPKEVVIDPSKRRQHDLRVDVKFDVHVIDQWQEKGDDAISMRCAAQIRSVQHSERRVAGGPFTPMEGDAMLWEQYIRPMYFVQKSSGEIEEIIIDQQDTLHPAMSALKKSVLASLSARIGGPPSLPSPHEDERQFVRERRSIYSNMSTSVHSNRGWKYASSHEVDQAGPHRAIYTAQRRGSKIDFKRARLPIAPQDPTEPQFTSMIDKHLSYDHESRSITKIHLKEYHALHDLDSPLGPSPVSKMERVRKMFDQHAKDKKDSTSDPRESFEVNMVSKVLKGNTVVDLVFVRDRTDSRDSPDALRAGYERLTSDKSLYLSESLQCSHERTKEKAQPLNKNDLGQFIESLECAVNDRLVGENRTCLKNLVELFRRKEDSTEVYAGTMIKTLLRNGTIHYGESPDYEDLSVDDKRLLVLIDALIWSNLESAQRVLAATLIRSSHTPTWVIGHAAVGIHLVDPVAPEFLDVMEEIAFQRKIKGSSRLINKEVYHMVMLALGSLARSHYKVDPKRAVRAIDIISKGLDKDLLATDGEGGFHPERHETHIVRIHTVGNAGMRHSLPVLLKHTEHYNPSVRKAVVFALRHFETHDGAGPDEADIEGRVGGIGPDVPHTKKEVERALLERAMTDPDDKIRKKASSVFFDRDRSDRAAEFFMAQFKSQEPPPSEFKRWAADAEAKKAKKKGDYEAAKREMRAKKGHIRGYDNVNLSQEEIGDLLSTRNGRMVEEVDEYYRTCPETSNSISASDFIQIGDGVFALMLPSIGIYYGVGADLAGAEMKIDLSNTIYFAYAAITSELKVIVHNQATIRAWFWKLTFTLFDFGIYLKFKVGYNINFFQLLYKWGLSAAGIAPVYFANNFLYYQDLRVIDNAGTGYFSLNSTRSNLENVRRQPGADVTAVEFEAINAPISGIIEVLSRYPTWSFSITVPPAAERNYLEAARVEEEKTLDNVPEFPIIPCNLDVMLERDDTWGNLPDTLQKQYICDCPAPYCSDSESSKGYQREHWEYPLFEAYKKEQQCASGKSCEYNKELTCAKKLTLWKALRATYTCKYMGPNYREQVLKESFALGKAWSQYLAPWNIGYPGGSIQIEYAQPTTETLSCITQAILKGRDCWVQAGNHIADTGRLCPAKISISGTDASSAMFEECDISVGQCQMPDWVGNRTYNDLEVEDRVEIAYGQDSNKRNLVLGSDTGNSDAGMVAAALGSLLGLTKTCMCFCTYGAYGVDCDETPGVDNHIHTSMYVLNKDQVYSTYCEKNKADCKSKAQGCVPSGMSTGWSQGLCGATNNVSPSSYLPHKPIGIYSQFDQMESELILVQTVRYYKGYDTDLIDEKLNKYNSNNIKNSKASAAGVGAAVVTVSLASAMEALFSASNGEDCTGINFPESTVLLTEVPLLYKTMIYFVGPVPVDFSLGIGLSLKLAFKFGFCILPEVSIEIGVSPSIAIFLEVSVSVTAVVARAGIGAQIDFVKGKFLPSVNAQVSSPMSVCIKMPVEISALSLIISTFIEYFTCDPNCYYKAAVKETLYYFKGFSDEFDLQAGSCEAGADEEQVEDGDLTYPDFEWDLYAQQNQSMSFLWTINSTMESTMISAEVALGTTRGAEDVTAYFPAMSPPTGSAVVYQQNATMKSGASNQVEHLFLHWDRYYGQLRMTGSNQLMATEYSWLVVWDETPSGTDIRPMIRDGDTVGDEEYTNTLSELTVNWDPFEERQTENKDYAVQVWDEYGEMVVNTTDTGEDGNGFPNTTYTFTNLALVNGRKYHFIVLGANTPAWTSVFNSTGIIPDITPPKGGEVGKNATIYIANTYYVATSWDEFYDPQSGIQFYEWRFGSSPSGSGSVFDWQYRGVSVHGVMANLELNETNPALGEGYWVSVRATNGADITGPSRVSGIVVIDPTPAKVLLIYTYYDIPAEVAVVKWSMSDAQSGMTGDYDIFISDTSNVPSDATWERVAAGDTTVTGSIYEYLIDNSRLPLPGLPVYISIRGQNKAGWYTIATGDPFVYDNTPPIITFVYDGMVGEELSYQSDVTSYAAHWSQVSDGESDVEKLWVAVGTAPGSDDIVSRIKLTDVTETEFDEGGLSLVHGQTYYCTVSAQNTYFYNVTASSSGVTIDTSPPNATGATVYTSATYTDQQFTSSRHTLAASWSGFVEDISELVSYQVAVGSDDSFSATLEDISDGFDDVGDGDTYTLISSLSLEHNTDYYITVMAWNSVDMSSIHTSTAIWTDFTRPTLTEVYLYDGADTSSEIDFQSDLTQLHVTWETADPESGVSLVEVAVGFDEGESNVAAFQAVSSASDTTATLSSLSLVHGYTYYVTVRSTNGAGTSVEESTNAVVVDTTPPVAGVVNDGYTLPDIDYQSSTTTIGANWEGFTDPESGVVNYDYAIVVFFPNGTADVLQDYQSVGTETSFADSTTFSLELGTKYYVRVRSTNGVGLTAFATTDGVEITVGVISGDVIDGNENVDLSFSADTTVVTASWSEFVALTTSIESYLWSVGTTPGGSDVLAATDLGISYVSSATAAEASFSSVYAYDFMAQAILSLESGVTYYTTVEAVTAVGSRVSATSDGFTADTVPPEASTSPAVRDGVSGMVNDIDYVSDSDAVSLVARVGFSDIQTSVEEYYYIVDGVEWTVPQNAEGPVTLVDADRIVVSPFPQSSTDWGTVNRVSVFVYNGVGLMTSSASDGLTVDATSPSGGVVYDGHNDIFGDIQYQTSTETYSMHWDSFVDDESPIARYEAGVGTASGNDDVLAFTAVVVGSDPSSRFVVFDGVTLAPGQTYYGSVRAVNEAGLTSSIVSSDGVKVDITPPTVGDVRDVEPEATVRFLGFNSLESEASHDDIDYQSSRSELRVEWSFFEENDYTMESADTYEIGVGSFYGGDDILPFAVSTSFEGGIDLLDTDDGLSVLITGLSLQDNFTYYAAVRATNGAGLSSVSSSDGVTVDHTAPECLSVESEFVAATSLFYGAWHIEDHESPVVDHEWAVGTHPGGSDLLEFTSVGEEDGGSVSVADVTFEGQSFYVSVRATNAAGLQSLCADGTDSDRGTTLDSTSPTAGVMYVGHNAPPSVSKQTEDTLFVQWSGFEDLESGLDHFEWAIYSVLGGVSTTVQNFTDVGLVSQVQSSNLTDGFYVISLRSYNGAYLYTEVGSDTVEIKVEDPVVTVGEVRSGTDDEDEVFQSSTTSVTCNWDVFLIGEEEDYDSDDFIVTETTIVEYLWAVGSTPSLDDVVSWRSSGFNFDGQPLRSVAYEFGVNETGLTTLQDNGNTTYYCNVRAVSDFSTTITGSSSGFQVDPTSAVVSGENVVINDKKSESNGRDRRRRSVSAFEDELTPLIVVYNNGELVCASDHYVVPDDRSLDIGLIGVVDDESGIALVVMSLYKMPDVFDNDPSCSAANLSTTEVVAQGTLAVTSDFPNPNAEGRVTVNTTGYTWDRGVIYAAVFNITNGAGLTSTAHQLFVPDDYGTSAFAVVRDGKDKAADLKWQADNTQVSANFLHVPWRGAMDSCAIDDADAGSGKWSFVDWSTVDVTSLQSVDAMTERRVSPVFSSADVTEMAVAWSANNTKAYTKEAIDRLSVRVTTPPSSSFVGNDDGWVSSGARLFYGGRVELTETPVRFASIQMTVQCAARYGLSTSVSLTPNEESLPTVGQVDTDGEPLSSLSERDSIIFEMTPTRQGVTDTKQGTNTTYQNYYTIRTDSDPTSRLTTVRLRTSKVGSVLLAEPLEDILQFDCSKKPVQISIEWTASMVTVFADGLKLTVGRDENGHAGSGVVPSTEELTLAVVVSPTEGLQDVLPELMDESDVDTVAEVYSITVIDHDPDRECRELHFSAPYTGTVAYEWAIGSEAGLTDIMGYTLIEHPCIPCEPYADVCSDRYCDESCTDTEPRFITVEKTGLSLDIMREHTTANPSRMDLDAICRNVLGLSDDDVNIDMALCFNLMGDNEYDYTEQVAVTTESPAHYFVSVRAFNSGCGYTVISSDGIGIDTTPPVMIDAAITIDSALSSTTVAGSNEDSDGPLIAYQSRSDYLAVSWYFADDESSIGEYEWALGTDEGATDVVNFTSTGLVSEFEIYDLTLEAEVFYYVTVRATNGAGLYTIEYSPPLFVHQEAPIGSSVVFDGDINFVDQSFQSSEDTISASWLACSDTIPMYTYEMAVGTAPQDGAVDDVLPFESVGDRLSYEFTGLELDLGETYFVTIRCTSYALLTANATSDGITVVDTTPGCTKLYPRAADDVDPDDTPTDISTEICVADDDIPTGVSLTIVLAPRQLGYGQLQSNSTAVDVSSSFFGPVAVKGESNMVQEDDGTMVEAWPMGFAFTVTGYSDPELRLKPLSLLAPAQIIVHYTQSAIRNLLDERKRDVRNLEAESVSSWKPMIARYDHNKSMWVEANTACAEIATPVQSSSLEIVDSCSFESQFEIMARPVTCIDLVDNILGDICSSPQYFNDDCDCVCPSCEDDTMYQNPDTCQCTCRDTLCDSTHGVTGLIASLVDGACECTCPYTCPEGVSQSLGGCGCECNNTCDSPLMRDEECACECMTSCNSDLMVHEQESCDCVCPKFRYQECEAPRQLNELTCECECPQTCTISGGDNLDKTRFEPNEKDGCACNVCRTVCPDGYEQDEEDCSCYAAVKFEFEQPPSPNESSDDGLATWEIVLISLGSFTGLLILLILIILGVVVGVRYLKEEGGGGGGASSNGEGL